MGEDNVNVTKIPVTHANITQGPGLALMHQMGPNLKTVHCNFSRQSNNMII